MKKNNFSNPKLSLIFVLFYSFNFGLFPIENKSFDSFDGKVPSREGSPPINAEIKTCYEKVSKCLNQCDQQYPASYSKFPDYKRNYCREECTTSPENNICRNLFKFCYK